MFCSGESAWILACKLCLIYATSLFSEKYHTLCTFLHTNTLVTYVVVHRLSETSLTLILIKILIRTDFSLTGFACNDLEQQLLNYNEEAAISVGRQNSKLRSSRRSPLHSVTLSIGVRYTVRHENPYQTAWNC